MASLTPRASGFWSDDMRDRDEDEEYEYGDDDDDLEGQERLLGGEEYDGRTPLDRTIDRIGMGSYQWTLLSLCGLGWMADNMWIQAIAIILPRVQQHYSVPDSYIGLVSSSMFGGMMLGAVGWGTCSDLMGRSTAFNATLFFTAVFGLIASFANSFTMLCIILFFLGSAVGGSMPTDGTLLLEHMPKTKQYLVTALSVFFSLGAVLSAVVALLVLPKNSCAPGVDALCDPATHNQGWKYLLSALGLITLSMFIARILFFRLHESPRFLVHAGRPADALKSLELISQFNGSALDLELEDVRDHHLPSEIQPKLDSPSDSGRPRATSRTIFDAGMIEGAEPGSRGSLDTTKALRGPLMTAYNSTGETPVLDPVAATALAEAKANSPPLKQDSPAADEDPASDYPPARASSIEPVVTPPPTYRTRSSTVGSMRRNRRDSAMSRRSSVYERKLCWSLPRWLRRPLWAWLDRVMMVLSPEWVRTTLLVWFVWCAMSLAYTMFNVFLPKLLETGTADVDKVTPKTLEASLWDVVIFTVGGCPGAILGAWLIESNLGRRWSLAGSTFFTAIFCVVFALVKAEWAVRASTVGISLSATAMWAVLYGWTPEIFGTKVRGTACGIASALSRIGGMIAPILGGVLLMMDRSVPVYTSVVIFAIAGLTVLLLSEETRDPAKERVVVH
ncbi:MFS general substrate transporter [Ephemerocybe angulata]|uniref:MFS general substrate transporter n=1 Tax=Ephemerocybe angulata TaxID=980116 RepID=A0A8H6I003_9AGAR|nr:MFS general substrate transporter [Tulosesus angulatus]